jgi:hypothetical protein
MSDYAIDLIRLGYKEKVQQFYTHVKGIGGTQILFQIEHSFCSELMKDAMRKIVNKRFKELEDLVST